MTSIADRWDTEHCPRGDGGRLRSVGSHSRDRYDTSATEPHFECSVCQRWWTVIELRRKPYGGCRGGGEDELS